MPSPEHEARVNLVRNDPGLAARLLRGLLGAAVPSFAAAEVHSAELSQLQPTQFHADSVVALRDPRGQPIAAVVVEVQRARDPKKRYTWPVYLATLRARLECPCWLVVLACDQKTARWATKPIDMGHSGWVLRPLALGPDDIPLITDASVAADQPGLAVLSALAHHDHPLRDLLLRALRDGVSGIAGKEGDMYIDIAFTGLPEAAQQHLEALVTAETYEFKSDFFRRQQAEGRAKGLAEGILAVFAARQMTVPDAVLERIQSSTDLDQLTAWLQRAVTAARPEDLLN